MLKVKIRFHGVILFFWCWLSFSCSLLWLRIDFLTIELQKYVFCCNCLNLTLIKSLVLIKPVTCHFITLILTVTACLSKHCPSSVCQLKGVSKYHIDTYTETLVWQLSLCLKWQWGIKPKVKVKFSLEKVWKW